MTHGRLGRIVSGVALLGALVAGAGAAELPRYKHDQISAYPAARIATSGALTVDGDLGDWQDAAFIRMCADPDLQQMFGCHLALAYDDGALYLAARYADTSPMANIIDPAVDPFRGWAGDALQVRVVADAALDHPVPESALNRDVISHLTFWYFTPKQLPVLDIRHGMDFHGAQTLTGRPAAVQYRLCDGGYTLEARVPWALLGTSRPPQPGERWIFTVQPQWGDTAGKHQHSFFDVMTSAGFHFQRPSGWGHALFVKDADVAATLQNQAAGDARLFAEAGSAERSSIPVAYTNPAKGFVSLAICRPDGPIVRTLLAKVAREAGPQREPWDGLDDNGRPAAPGTYTVKALSHPGITPKFVCSVHNSGNPSWGNAGGRYGWGADHGLPINATSDPDGNTYLLWTFNEGGKFLIKVDARGQKLWGANISWGDFNCGATAVAYDHGLLYVTKDGVQKGQGRGGLFAYNAETGARANFPGGQGIVPVTEWTPNPAHAAPTDPLWERIKTGRFDAADFDANLTGLAVAPDRLYCALFQEDCIVALDKQTFRPVSTNAVPRPANLTWDPATRTLLAVSGQSVVRLDPASGAVTPFITRGIEYPVGLALDADGLLWVSTRGTQMQVLGFDRAGKLRRRIGTAGGRPWIGRYDPRGLLLPAGICVDRQGQLWVTEYDATPKRVSLWNTRNGRLINEFFGSAAYAPMMAPDLEKPEQVFIHNCRFRVDYETGQVTPEATVYRANVDGPSIPGSEAGYGFMGATFQISRHQGRTFALNGNGGVFAVAKDRFRPIQYLGNAYPGLPFAPPLSLHTPVVWSDGNGDGLVQSNEVRVVAGGGLANNIAQFGATFYPGAGLIKSKKLFRPAGLTPAGFPAYPQPEQAEPILTGTGPMTAYSNWMDVWPSLTSDWQEFYAIASLPRGGALDGGGEDGIYRFNRQGDIRWRYNRVAVFYALKAPLARMGDLYGALRIAGEVALPRENGGEIVGIGVYRGYFGFLNEDGLFIDQVGYDNGRGPAPNFDVFYIENFSGYFFRHPRTGKVYLFCGDVDGRILELQGWSNIRRLPDAPLMVTEQHYQATLAAAAAGGGDGTPAPLAVTAATPALDGTLQGWEAHRPRTLALDETHAAQVSLARDDRHLYARFSVEDPTPWQNASTDWHYLFKGGDAVDIQLGIANPSPAQKRKPQAGDVRVLVGPAADGGVTAVGMWGQAPAGLAKEPQRYQSPVGETSFERVARMPDVKAKLQRTAEGYTLELAIPWSGLGLAAPARHAQWQGDVGVLLSDGSGARTTGRRYLFNRETTIINDIPSEVRVESTHWGVLVFE